MYVSNERTCSGGPELSSLTSVGAHHFIFLGDAINSQLNQSPIVGPGTHPMSHTDIV
jgi:hypothetical protein